MGRKEEVKRQFGLRAESYVTSHIHRKGEDLNLLVELAELQGEEVLLDVATGGGHTANAFAPYVQKVTAMDLTPEMLRAAETFINGNSHTNVDFVEGDAEKMPFADDTFDIVTCRIAPHHFPHALVFISEVYRVLKPGGLFLLDDNVAPEDEELDEFYNTIEKKRDYSHHRAWKKTEWMKMLELNEFDIEAMFRFEKQFHFEDWCNRMQLPNTDKFKLTKQMMDASEKIKRKFRIQITERQIESFYAEAMVLKAVKRIL